MRPLVESRHQQILELLASQQSVTVAELSDLLGVSSVTVRADLNQLAEENLVIRTHGGARLARERMRQEYTFTTRQRINAKQKHCIGNLAASLVLPNEAILLDASTTAVAVGQALKRNTEIGELTVVTTGIWTALELLGAPHINILLTGGHLRTTTGSIAGSITHEILGRLNFSKAFLGAWGITLEEGLTDSPLMEVELKQAIIRQSQEVIAVLDGSKFGRAAVASFALVSDIARIITDDSAPPEMVAALQAQGVDVSIACDDED